MALIRKHSQVYSTAIFFFNSFAVTLAWLLAYFVKFKLELFSAAGMEAGDIEYLAKATVLSPSIFD